MNNMKTVQQLVKATDMDSVRHIGEAVSAMEDKVAANDDYVANINAIVKAKAALQNGMAGSSLQTISASVLKGILRSPVTRSMLDGGQATNAFVSV